MIGIQVCVVVTLPPAGEMQTEGSRREAAMEIWLHRMLLCTAWALFLWLLLRTFVPAHPIEQAPESLTIAAALVCATSAKALTARWARYILLGAAVALVCATFLL